MSASASAPSQPTLAEIVAKYDLKPHPEGGFFAEWHRSPAVAATPGGERSAATAILYAVEAGGKSSLHAIKSAELWFYHAGDELTVVELEPPAAPGGAAAVRRTRLGPGPAAGATLVHTVAAGVTFGAHHSAGAGAGAGYTLVSCVVAPGFDPRDWEMVSGAELRARFPGDDAASAIAHLSTDA
jgi:uncharacterized protein